MSAVVDDESARIWVVRAGQGAAHADLFLRESLVAIGFGGAESVEGLDWKAVTAHMRVRMPDATSVGQGLAAGALFRFANEMKIGDFVLTPEPGGSLLAGEVIGPYQFVDAAPAEDFRHLRRVRWFTRITRSSLPKESLASIRSIMTLFIPSHQDELRALMTSLRHGSAPEPRTASPTKQKREPVTIPWVEIPPEPAPPPTRSGSEFETDKRKMLYMLDQIANRDLALPDFQRSFVWDAGATRELLVSIIRGFPAGTLLFLDGGSEVFLPRAVEGAPALDGQKPKMLILDGQQRLTSLFQALTGVGTHRFFVDIAALMEGADIDTAVKTVSAVQARAWTSREAQARALLFPLSEVHNYLSWRDDVLEVREEDNAESRKRLRRYLTSVESSIIRPIHDYQFPLTTLSQGTPTEAVCTIFETLNRTGIKLSVFELLTARAFASGERLRERWHDALERYPVLEDFEVDPYYILQAIALRLGKKPRRGAVVSLAIADVAAEWENSIRGMAEGLTMLRDECGVLTAKWLPYAPMLPTLAAVWRDVETSHGAHAGASRLKLQQWFWCASFEGAYDSAPNSRAEADVPLLRSWLGGGEPPPNVRDFSFDSTRWLETTVRQRGLYRSTMALIARRRPLDFHQAVPLTRTIMESTGVDDHHVFPAAYLREHGITGYVDTVLNHTLIDKETNRRIGKKAPSVYTAEMRAELGDKIDRILDSHALPSEPDGPLLTDDYDSFLEWRMDCLERELSRAVS